MEHTVYGSGIGIEMIGSADAIMMASAQGLPVFQVKRAGRCWNVTCSDNHCGGEFAERAAALKFAREEAELCNTALVCGYGEEERPVDWLVVQHPGS